MNHTRATMVFLAFLSFSVSEEEESSRSKVGEEGKMSDPLPWRAWVC